MTIGTPHGAVEAPPYLALPLHAARQQCLEQLAAGDAHPDDVAASQRNFDALVTYALEQAEAQRIVNTREIVGDLYAAIFGQS